MAAGKGTAATLMVGTTRLAAVAGKTDPRCGEYRAPRLVSHVLAFPAAGEAGNWRTAGCTSAGSAGGRSLCARGATGASGTVPWNAVVQPVVARCVKPGFVISEVSGGD